MDKSIRSQLQNFFEQFTELSERAAKHWPIIESSEDPEKDCKADYKFTCITTQDELNMSENISDMFFDTLYKNSFVFSPCFLPSSQEEIRSRIREKESLFEDLKNKQKYLYNVYTFLILAYIATENGEPDKIDGGLVLNYYPVSRSILIESILLSEDNEFTQTDRVALFLKMVAYKKRDENDRPQDNLNGDNDLYSQFTRLILKLNKTFRANNCLERITGIYHEANDPVLIKGKQEKQQAADVLDSFHKASAKHIRFSYRRPVFPFSTDPNFFLLYFPALLPYKTNQLMVDIKEVMQFIIDRTKDKNQQYNDYSNDINLAKQDPSVWNDEFKGIDFDEQNSINLNAVSLVENSYSGHYTELYLSNVPRLERPKFLYKRAAICFEILVDEDYFDPIGLRYDDNVRPPDRPLTTLGKYVEMIKEEWQLNEDPKPRPLNCIVAHSTETDLFAYRYQSDPPYFTKYYNLEGGNDIMIKLPSHFDFTSEGRQETYYVLPSDNEPLTVTEKNFMSFTRELPMEVHLSYTYFLPSNVRVWHMVFTPREQLDASIPTDNSTDNLGISELDIIKLMKFFSGSQENASEKDKQDKLKDIRFSYKQSENTASNSLQTNNTAFKQLLNIAFRIWKAPSFLLKRVFKSFNIFRRWIDSKIYEKPVQSFIYEDPSEVIKLLESIAGITYKLRPERKDDPLLKPEDHVLSLRNLRSGIIEIDTGDSEEPDATNLLGFDKYNFDVFCRENAKKLSEHNISDPEKLKKKIREEIKKSYAKLYKKEENDSTADSLLGEDDDDPIKEYANYVFKAYCGICLGIFDYDRMGLEEIDDTLMPLEDSKTEQSFQALNRGALSMFGYEEDVMNTFWKTLGISPYLLIPSAVLAHNDSVSLDAERRLDTLLNNIRTGKSTFSIPELISARHEIDDLLNDDILLNVFHYKTEKGIYNEGMKSRGIEERIKFSRQKLDQLEKEIEEKQKERESKYQNRIQALLAILSLINFYAIIRDYFVDELAFPSEKADKIIIWKNVVVDEWLKDAVNYRFPEWLRTWLINNWHSFKSNSLINSLGLSHMTFAILIASAILWFVLTRIFDPSKSGKSKFLRNRKKRSHKLPKIQEVKSSYRI
jgi:hypothetical protein